MPWISLTVKSLYLIPSILFIGYYTYIKLHVKRQKDVERKMYYKLQIFEVLFICIFIYLGKLLFEIVLFNEIWTDKHYIISFIFMLILCLISSIVGRVNSPKNFRRQYMKEKSKSSIINYKFYILAFIIMIFFYLYKRGLTLLMCSYALLILMSSVISSSIFVYKQYDKIEELRKKFHIN